MKYIVWLSPLIFVPAIVGMALVLSGYSAGAWVLALGIPAVMIILVIIGLVLMMKGKLFNKPSEDNGQPKKEKELSDVREINRSHYYTNRFKLAEYEARHIIEGTKNSSKKGIAAGILFFLMLVSLAILATVFTI
ncbi:MAG: hypothetical protein K2G96_05590, partial [Clostridia bacterium]|nr:hypothetical protein [Clostridia bacterium]